MGSVNLVLRQQFIRDGFVLFKGVLEPEMVEGLRAWSDVVLGEQEEEHFRQHRTTGSMVLIDWAMAYEHDVLAELIANPSVLAALAELGFAEPKFGHGRIISKPPLSPPLFWHEDGRFWDDPVSYTWQPIQTFLMYSNFRMLLETVVVCEVTGVASHSGIAPRSGGVDAILMICWLGSVDLQ